MSEAGSESAMSRRLAGKVAIVTGAASGIGRQTARLFARAALFLASDESSYVNGTTFLVDGGITSAYVTAE